jgi:hypothetical protein
MVKIFKIVSQNGDTECWATNNLEIDDLGIVKYTEWNWAIENYHRGIKQYCGIERAQVRGSELVIVGLKPKRVSSEKL